MCRHSHTHRGFAEGPFPESGQAEITALQCFLQLSSSGYDILLKDFSDMGLSPFPCFQQLCSTQQRLMSLLLNDHDLRQTVEKPTMVPESFQPSEKTLTLPWLLLKEGFGKGSDCFLTDRWNGRCCCMAALHHCESQGNGTAIRKPFYCGAERSFNSHCHRPDSDSAQTQTKKALPHLNPKLNPCTRDRNRHVTGNWRSL